MLGFIIIKFYYIYNYLKYYNCINYIYIYIIERDDEEVEDLLSITSLQAYNSKHIGTYLLSILKYRYIAIFKYMDIDRYGYILVFLFHYDN